MNVVFIILSVLIVLAAILLIAVVLLQNSKGDGMASNFVAGNQTFGVRQTADILENHLGPCSLHSGNLCGQLFHYGQPQGSD